MPTTANPGLITMQNPNFPRILSCDQCRQSAVVKAYLPIYIDLDWQTPPAQEPKLKAMTCIIDCARCGVRNQIIPVAE
jgi:hypothetical protein